MHRSTRLVSFPFCRIMRIPMLCFTFVGYLTTINIYVVESFSFHWKGYYNHHYDSPSQIYYNTKNQRVINSNVQSNQLKHSVSITKNVPFVKHRRHDNVILFQSTIAMGVNMEPLEIQQQTVLYELRNENEEDSVVDIKQNTEIDSTKNVNPSTIAKSKANENEKLLHNKLIEWFQGDFDNYNQVVQDRKDGYVPKEGGGHEHIHCTLVPLDYYYSNSTDNDETTTSGATTTKKLASRLAAFYFDGVPKFIFRFRYYELVATTPNTVDTILYTLHPELEAQLRVHSTEPTLWPSIFHNFQPQTQPPPTTTNSNNNNSNNNQSIPTNVNTDDYTTSDVRIRILPGCDVRWSFILDPIQHLYAIEYNADQQRQQQKKSTNDTSNTKKIIDTSSTSTVKASDVVNGIHAVMVYGEALVDSQMKPGSKILIQDQISIWENQLWIHDRGFDPTTGNFIYGNQRNIPYALERVANFIPSNTTSSTNNVTTENKQQQQPVAQLVRQILNPDLAWTMGTEYRSNEQYDERIQNMGGPSINIPMSSSKNALKA